MTRCTGLERSWFFERAIPKAAGLTSRRRKRIAMDYTSEIKLPRLKN
jgi:hypothetical protein